MMDAEHIRAEIERMLHKVDLVNRPYAIYCHPSNKAKISNAAMDAVVHQCYFVALTAPVVGMSCVRIFSCL